MTTPRTQSSILLMLATTGTLMGATGKPSTQVDHHEIEVVIQKFLSAFENLDMPIFIEYFANDATMFFPAPDSPMRFEGRASIQKRFEEVFEAIRKSSGADRPPFHKLIPVGLLIQPAGRDSAIVSFHLKDDQRVSRRTLVLKKIRGAWRIAHLHASNMAVAP